MDETGLFFRCLPSLAYFQAGCRRRARGIKAMKAKDHVTLVLAVNARWSHKISVAAIGKAAASFCLKPPRVPWPLFYFSHILRGWTVNYMINDSVPSLCRPCGPGRGYHASSSSTMAAPTVNSSTHKSLFSRSHLT